jgi:N-acetylmuramoyl-L-alanine amidase
VPSRILAASVLALVGLAATACAAGADGASRPAAERRPPSSDHAAGAERAEEGDDTEAAANATERASASQSAPRKPLVGKTVVIDPGHNGGNSRHPEIVNRQVNVLTKWKACDTTGTATSDGYAEAAFNWDVSRRLVAILRSRGADVKLTRSDNTGAGPCITERAAIGNRAGADAVISVHADGSAPANRGFHVIMPKKINGPVDPVVDRSRRLGLAVREAFRDGTGLPYSTYIGRQALDYRDDLGGLNLSTVPKVFIECGNMKNPTEARLMRDAKFRQRIARSLADGLQRFLT